MITLLKSVGNPAASLVDPAALSAPKRPGQKRLALGNMNLEGFDAIGVG
jgi:hypothetical protein